MSAEEKFTTLEPGITIPVCNKCKHYMSDRICRAFKVIPDVILEGKNNHNKPLPGQDNNIVFEEIKKGETK